ncbi:Proteasome subunit beta type-2 [Strongyloides ratti]|uniref:Proteasome subunit beta n=1 Tax=Strongyloides ratti TaxID=34506 RepID=A0A090L939_STRRB|nr:Proteasome subunit beta type-2 [Strongyloides ratti]CEF66242.1 Proteasome subunit beta type-2 [Strongyloides ratti]
MSGLHFLAGIRTDDYVILASDKSGFAYGAVVLTEDQKKEYQLGEKLYMTLMGEDGDCSTFGDFAQKNLHLYQLRNGYEIGPRSAHHWLRSHIAKSLRSRDAYQVELLLGGYDDYEKKAFLGSIDYLGNGIPDQNYLFRGFCGRFCYAIMDNMYRRNMSEEDGLVALRKCLEEGKKRFIANVPKFSVMVIDKNGVRHLEDIVL